MSHLDYERVYYYCSQVTIIIYADGPYYNLLKCNESQCSRHLENHNSLFGGCCEGFIFL
jgi:hypothetical protein